MKLNILSNKYHFNPQDIQRYQINEQDNNNFSKSQSTYPQDKVDVSSISKCVIQSIDNRQVELTYSIALKKVSAEIINKDRSIIQIKNENLPKELREISCPKVFDAFLKNTYAKVSPLGNGEHKLDINQRLLGGMIKAKKSYESGSITPTTQGKTQFSFSKSSEYINKKENRITESKEIFDKIKELDQKITNPSEKLFQQAKSYSIKDKYDAADGLAQKAILLYKKCEVLKNELVDQLYEVEKDELAEQLNREFKISYADLLFFTGLNLSKKDDSEYENACKYYQQAINMHPDRCTPYMNKHQDFIKSMEDVIKHIANTKSDNKELDISNIKLTGSEIKYSIAPQIENNVGNFKNIEKLVVSWSKLGDSGTIAFSKED
jgi:tetratricopeptide (TPR) repeat protein